MTLSPAVMRTPRTVDVDITSRCNLRCRYCYFFDDESRRYRDLPAAAWVRFFEECGRAGVMGLTIAGGEPFIREDLPELLASVVRNRMRFSILSNGGLVDDRLAAFIAGTGRCDQVQISVDGAQAETHDVFRGAGAFAGAQRGLRTLQRHRVPVTARVTIHRYNISQLEAIARLLLDDLGIPAISTNAAGYLGACRRSASEVLLTPDQRTEAMARLGELAARYPGRITAQAGPLAEGRLWAEMERGRRDGSPACAGGGRLSGCGCTSSSIAVRPDGVYVPCTMLPAIELGGIATDALTEVWSASPALLRLRLRHRTELARFEECRACDYRPHCTGNCPGLAFSLTGDVDRPSPDACLKRFLDAGGALPGNESPSHAAGAPSAR